jgi:hypothetical protein
MATRLSLALTLVLALSASAYAAQNEDYVHVELRGILHSGEGNHAFVEANGKFYRLDLGESKNLAKFVALHDQQPVIASGSLLVDSDASGRVHNLTVDVKHFETALVENVSFDGNPNDTADREHVGDRGSGKPVGSGSRQRQ